MWFGNRSTRILEELGVGGKVWFAGGPRHRDRGNVRCRLLQTCGSRETPVYSSARDVICTIKITSYVSLPLVSYGTFQRELLLRFTGDWPQIVPSFTAPSFMLILCRVIDMSYLRSGAVLSSDTRWYVQYFPAAPVRLESGSHVTPKPQCPDQLHLQ